MRAKFSVLLFFSCALARTASAEGKISSVTCYGNEMQLTVASADKSLLLHTDDYTKIQYLAGSNSSMGDLDQD